MQEERKKQLLDHVRVNGNWVEEVEGGFNLDGHFRLSDLRNLVKVLEAPDLGKGQNLQNAAIAYENVSHALIRMGRKVVGKPEFAPLPTLRVGGSKNPVLVAKQFLELVGYQVDEKSFTDVANQVGEVEAEGFFVQDIYDLKRLCEIGIFEIFIDSEHGLMVARKSHETQ